jgi:hypothetical protein
MRHENPAGLLPGRWFSFRGDRGEPRLFVNQPVDCHRNPAVDLGFHAGILLDQTVEQVLEGARLDLDLGAAIGMGAQ